MEQIIPPNEKIEQLTARVAELEQQVEELSRDPLTGWLKEEPAKKKLMLLVQKNPQLESPITMIMVDLKNLKQVNDEISHAAGDELIKGFTGFIKKFVEQRKKSGFYNLVEPILFRVYDHGDEFGVILIGVGNGRQHDELEAGLREELLEIEVSPGIKRVVDFRTGFASTDQDPNYLPLLRERFKDPRERAAEIFRYLRNIADLAERKKRENG